jgi:hypothetical protein
MVHCIAAQKADVKYSGSVHFTGVGGRMDLTLADPEIVVNNGDDHVIMSVKSKTMVGQSVDHLPSAQWNSSCLCSPGMKILCHSNLRRYSWTTIHASSFLEHSKNENLWSILLAVLLV